MISLWYRWRSLPQTVVPVTLQTTSVGSVIAGTGASRTRTSSWGLELLFMGEVGGLPLLPYHCRVSCVSPGRISGSLVVVVGRSPIAFCAWLATVVVIPGGVILEVILDDMLDFKF